MSAAIISLSVLLVLVTFGLIGMILWHLLKKPNCGVSQNCPKTKCPEVKNTQCVGFTFSGTSTDSKKLIKAISGVLYEFQKIGCSRLTAKEVRDAMTNALNEGLQQIEDVVDCEEIKSKILDGMAKAMESDEKITKLLSEEELKAITDATIVLLTTVLDLSCVDSKINAEKVKSVWYDVLNGFCPT